VVAVSVRPPATYRTPIIVTVYGHRRMFAFLALKLPPNPQNTSFSSHSIKKEGIEKLKRFGDYLYILENYELFESKVSPYDFAGVIEVSRNHDGIGVRIEFWAVVGIAVVNVLHFRSKNCKTVSLCFCN